VAIVLVLLSLAEEQANIGAAVGGALAGTLLGLVLPIFTRKTTY
jgi:flagellar motor component MotA